MKAEADGREIRQGRAHLEVRVVAAVVRDAAEPKEVGHRDPRDGLVDRGDFASRGNIRCVVKVGRAGEHERPGAEGREHDVVPLAGVERVEDDAL